MLLDFQQKRRFRNIFYSKITISILTVLCIYAIYSTFRVYGKMKDSALNLSKTEEKVFELEAKKKELDGKIERLKTEDGIEKEIRSKFAVAKENESMVIIVTEDFSTTTIEKNDSQFWMKIKKFFGF